MRKNYYINGWPAKVAEYESALDTLKKQSAGMLMVHFELEKNLSIQFLNDVLVADHSPAIVIQVDPRGESHYLQCYGPTGTMFHLGRILYADYDVVARMRMM